MIKLAMDSIDFAILEELQADARITFVELGRRVGLSTPSVVERVKKLEESKVIVGYHAEVCPDKIGLSMTAIVKVTVSGERVARFAALIAEVPEVLRCHRVTGVESYILHVAVENTAHLACVIDSLMPYVSTNTSIILASPVEWGPIRPRKLHTEATGPRTRPTKCSA